MHTSLHVSIKFVRSSILKVLTCFVLKFYLAQIITNFFFFLLKTNYHQFATIFLSLLG